jgi:hypothetical protein
MKRGNEMFQFMGRTCCFKGSRYANNDAPAIRVVSSETRDPMSVLTVNMPPHIPQEGEIFVKTWSENEGITSILRDSEFFRDTGKRVSNGFVEAEIWEVLVDIDFGPAYKIQG